MWESMGKIADRTKDYLGVSDGAVAQFRRMMVSAAEAVRDGGSVIGTPKAGRKTKNSELISFEGMIPKAGDWKEASNQTTRQNAA